MFRTHRSFTIYALLCALPIGVLVACGGSGGGSGNPDKYDASPFTDTYTTTITPNASTTAEWSGDLTVDDDGDISGTLDFGPYTFVADGEVKPDGTITFTTTNPSAENIFSYGNTDFNGKVTKSSGTVSGTVTYTLFGGPRTSAIKMVRQTASLK